jgi:hypothetical protein
MSDKFPPIYFYLPEADWPVGNLLESPESYQEVIAQSTSTGTYGWILQTYLHLKASGFPCTLIGTIPTEGIVLAYRKTLPEDLQPGSKLLLVCVQGDEGQHPFAQVHLVQNSQELLKPYRLLGDRILFPGEIYFMPYWPQPGAIPRDASRGDRFENIAYVGREMNLAPELLDPSWQEKLKALGLQWQVISARDRWNDYSQIDAILAVRSFNRPSDYHWKPAAKLYNAWHAGVPAIIGVDSAYRAERQSKLDYIEVKSPSEAIAALVRLRDDTDWRHAMVENGKIRAQETTPETLVLRWKNLLTDVVVPAYHRWSNSSNLTRQAFLTRRSLAVETKDQRKNIQSWRNRLGLRTRLRSLISKKN